MSVSLASREEFGKRITSLPPPSHVSNAPADEWEEGEERAADEDLDQPLVLVDERDEFSGLQNIVVRLLLDRLAGARQDARIRHDNPSRLIKAETLLEQRKRPEILLGEFMLGLTVIEFLLTAASASASVA